jgi:L-lactate dehydrogenase complex protein LldE
MQAALLVPCYIDMFYPHVGIATLELLEKLGVDVAYPKDQTCCGQPMANSGCCREDSNRLPLARFECRYARGVNTTSSMCRILIEFPPTKH